MAYATHFRFQPKAASRYSRSGDAGSAFAYHPNASTHGPPTSSAVLANLGKRSPDHASTLQSEWRRRLLWLSRSNFNSLALSFNDIVVNLSPNVRTLIALLLTATLVNAALTVKME